MGMSDYYKKLREKVGNELIFMPCAAGIVRNDLREILLPYKGNGEKWSLPAGAIELGEAPAEAVIRDVWEETGLNVLPKKLLGIFGGEDFRYQYPTGHQVEYNVFMFECIIQSGRVVNYIQSIMRLLNFNILIQSICLKWLYHIHRESSEVYFQRNDEWLKNPAQK
ncbi:mutT/nudix family protein [Bacillus sp. ZZV12-4809]|nr:mutT/nudix family protein [Bacillus sp. ZZV12-4809]